MQTRDSASCLRSFATYRTEGFKSESFASDRTARRHYHTDQTLTLADHEEPCAIRYSLRRMQGGAMERERLGEEPEAETPLSHLDRARTVRASTNPPAQGPYAREGI